MASVVTTVADVVNLALVRLGYHETIGDIYEGSKAANAALAIYGQTRDETLRISGWGFAESTVALSLLKQAPATGYGAWRPWSVATDPPLPWRYEYLYPDDCLQVRAIRDTPLFLMNPDPQVHRFSVDNDATFTPSKKVILSNTENAILLYTRQVTNPLAWEPDFTEALSIALAHRLEPVLMKVDPLKVEAQDVTLAKQVHDPGEA